MEKRCTDKYIALEEHDFCWGENEIREFRRMWNANIPFTSICKILKRTHIEVGILLMDQSHKGHVKRRKIGLGIRGFEK
jgi:hypothetical protein